MTRQNELANGSSVAHFGQSIVLVAFDGCGTAAGAGVFQDRTLALAVLIIRIYKVPAAAVAEEQTLQQSRRPSQRGRTETDERPLCGSPPGQHCNDSLCNQAIPESVPPCE